MLAGACVLCCNKCGTRHFPHRPTQVDAAVAALAETGVPMGVMRRTNRHGYKAGAMVDGLAALKEEGFE